MEAGPKLGKRETWPTRDLGQARGSTGTSFYRPTTPARAKSPVSGRSLSARWDGWQKRSRRATSPSSQSGAEGMARPIYFDHHHAKPNAPPSRLDENLVVAALETRLLLVADTHLGFGEGSRLTARIAEHLSAADAVLHAGDLNDASILEALRDSAPHADVYAVAGNTDGRIELPERITLELGGCAVGLVHNSRTRIRTRGSAARLVPRGRSRRLRPLPPALARGQRTPVR